MIHYCQKMEGGNALNEERAESKNVVKNLVYISLFIAISFIGSLIKIQGTIALDSMAGFFVVLFLNPVSGAIVGSVGHLLTAFINGLPLTLPIHLIVSLQMAVVVYLFGWIHKKTNLIVASLVAITLNGIVSVIMLAPLTTMLGLPLQGKTFIYVMVGPLTLASAVNVTLAGILHKIIKDRI